MNPGPTLGLIAVVAAYVVVLGALLIFIQRMSSKRKRLERKRIHLHDVSKGR
jgi:O-antigen/teichoic acid export membrane protein